MPRYHFHVHDGFTRMDAEGSELPNLQAARAEALKRAGAIIADAGARADFGEEWRLEVTEALIGIRGDGRFRPGPERNSLTKSVL